MSTPTYRYPVLSTLRHDGRDYPPGGEVWLTVAEAAALPSGVIGSVGALAPVTEPPPQGVVATLTAGNDTGWMVLPGDDVDRVVLQPDAGATLRAQVCFDTLAVVDAGTEVPLNLLDAYKGDQVRIPEDATVMKIFAIGGGGSYRLV